MKLFTGPISLFAKKVEIAAYEKNIPLEFEWVPFSLKDRYQPKHPDVMRINPKQQVPVIIDDDLELFDSTLIFEYFEDIQPEPPLWPQDPKQRARARLLELTSDEIIVGKILDLVNLGNQLTDEKRAEIVAHTQEQFKHLDRQLADSDYFMGDFSYADIAIYCGQILGNLFNMRIPKELPNLQNWRLRMSERESVKKAMQPMLDYIETARNQT